MSTKFFQKLLPIRNQSPNRNDNTCDVNGFAEDTNPVNAADVVKPYLKLVDNITEASKAISKAYNKSQYNKKTCATLLTRVEFAACAVKSLIRGKEDHMKDFRNQDYYKSFAKFARVTKSIRKFVEDISQLSKFKKFTNSQSIRDMLRTILEDFDACSSDLRLQISVDTENDMNILNDDLKQMEFLTKSYPCAYETEHQEYNEQYMVSISTVREQVKVTNSEIKKNIDPTYQVNQILFEELKNSSGNNIERGNIVKRCYKGIDVACKRVDIEMDNETQVERFKARLSILENLHLCDNIIRFYGMSKLGDNDYMVYGWAERHSLKEVYEKHKFSLCEKVSIAFEICQGLVFLNATGIYHHDIRCENILMTSKLEPKIANFAFARVKNKGTNPEKNPKSSLNWMAPEKIMELMDPSVSSEYTPGCEIFSFGMLLWELKYERIPYKDKNALELMDYVTSGKREELNYNLSPYGLDQKYAEIIKRAWEHDSNLRIELASLFDEIRKLNACSKHNEHIKFTDKTCCFETTSTIKVIPPMDDGISAYNKKKYRKAFNIFKDNVESGNSDAKFWIGELYRKGKFVEKDIDRALKYYEEAANEGHTKAKFQYAISFINLYFDDELQLQKKGRLITHNLRTAAADGHTEAQYTLGEIYWDGKFGKVDKQLAIQYYEMAARKNHGKAIETLKDKGVDINK